MSGEPSEQVEAKQPGWRPIRAIDRRALGVLVEKAKTTPEAYPLSVNALRTGCNQKNNRDPLMEVESEDVEESLARLRALGAVVEVQGGGRVPRFRHLLYEWLGVEKVELAVMAELLLRGGQTEGELRGRAARMEPIADLQALRPVLAALKAKGLVVALTPEGRGHVVTHALYEPDEMEHVRAHFRGNASNREEASDREEPAPAWRSAEPALRQSSPDSGSPVATAAHFARGSDVTSRPTAADVDALRREVDELRAELAEVRKTLDELRAAWS